MLVWTHTEDCAHKNETHTLACAACGYVELIDLSSAITALLDSEDDTGCTDDLTVVSKEAAEALKDAYQKWRAGLSK